MKNAKKLAIVIAIVATAIAVASLIVVLLLPRGENGCKHTNLETIAITEASCITEGIQQRSCLDCGAILKIEKIAKLQHKEVIDAAIAPTCTKTGLTEGSHCAFCNKVIIAQTVVDFTDHDKVVDAAVAPSCSKTGLTEGVHCSMCNTVIVAQNVVEKLAHSYDDSYDETCNECGFVRDAQCAHNLTITLTGRPATCTVEGLTSGKKCKICEEILVLQSAIPKIPHTEEPLPGIAATCLRTGLTEGKRCMYCGFVLVERVTIPKADHTESDWIIDEEATQNTDGKRHTECTVCGITIKEEVISATGSTGFEYEVNRDGLTCTITDIGDCTDTAVRIPDYIGPYKVTAIASYLFALNSDIVSVTIGDTVTSIDYLAFSSCENLESVKIGKNVTSIGDAAFAGCQKLKSISVDKDNPAYKTIDGNLYANDGRILTVYAAGKTETSFTVPDSVISIGACAFAVSKLEKIVISDNVETIGSEAFNSCANLSGVVLGDSLKEIPARAFVFCTGLTGIDIPDSVTSIENDAFRGCTSLESVEFSKNSQLTSIGDRAFKDCISLKSIEFPDSVADFGDNIFEGCDDVSHNIIIPDDLPEEDRDVDKYYEYYWDTKTINVELSEHTCAEELTSRVRRYLAGGDSAANDPIDADVRRRNANAEKVTRTKINYTYLPDISTYAWGQNISRIANESQSYSDTSADIYVNFMYDMVGASLQGAFANLKSTEMYGSEGVNYFEFTASDYNPVVDDEGYMYDLMSSMSLSTKKMYVLASDYLMDTVRAFFVVPVNIEMINSIDVCMVGGYNYDYDDKFDTEDFFSIISNNDWNYNAVKTLSMAVVNQAGEYPSLMDDTHGFALGSTVSGIHGAGILYGSGIEIISRELNEETGYYDVSYPESAGAFGEFADALADLFSSAGVTNINTGSNSNTPAMIITKLFSRNQMLLGGVICAGNLEQPEYQAMNAAGMGFGVAPVPVYRAFDASLDIDEYGRNRYYHTAVHNVAKVAAISVSTTKFKHASAWLDYQSTHSDDILEQYYENKLQYAYSGNNAHNVEVLKMIRENVSTALDKCYDDTIRSYAGYNDLSWSNLIRRDGSWIHDDIRTKYTEAVEFKTAYLEQIQEKYKYLHE